MRHDPTSSYSEGWNLACTWYAPGPAQHLSTLFNQHCQEIGVAPFVALCSDETEQAFSGFAAAWRYLDANLRFQRTRNFQLTTACLGECVKKASQLYASPTEEDLGDHDWRVYAPRLLNNTTVGEAALTLPLLSDWIAQHQRDNLHAQALCIMEHDPLWFGSQVHVGEKVVLQVFANIYVCSSALVAADYQGGTEPIARIYRYEFLKDEHVLAGLALRDDLTRLAEGLPALLKYPSHLQEAWHTVYGTVLFLLLDRGVPKELADPVREFLATFHSQLEHRQNVTTWDYNGKWSAARVVQRATAEQEEQIANAVGPVDTEGQALELLYALFPDLR